MDIEDVIKYEHECTYVDFKFEEYGADKKGEFIKDIVAFANADYIGDRYIIIGLKKSGNTFKFNDINNPEDGAAIQQRISSNIEPELEVSYNPYCYEGENLVILTIKHPTNPPYVITKDINNKGTLTKKGECWVRKGQRKEVASRKDFDRMYARLLDKDDFKGVINLTFKESGNETLIVSPAKDISLPSASKIQTLKYHIALKKQEQKSEKDPFLNPLALYKIATPASFFTSGKIDYSQYSLEELEDRLDDVVKKPFECDKIYLFEKQSIKVNFMILNTGDEYLKDVTIEVKISKNEGLIVFTEFLKYQNVMVMIPSYEETNYPVITDDEKYYYVVEKLGNLKHKIQERTFNVPFRIFIGQELTNKEIILTCTFYGENTKKPIVKDLKIRIENNIDDDFSSIGES